MIWPPIFGSIGLSTAHSQQHPDPKNLHQDPNIPWVGVSGGILGAAVGNYCGVITAAALSGGELVMTLSSGIHTLVPAVVSVTNTVMTAGGTVMTATTTPVAISAGAAGLSLLPVLGIIAFGVLGCIAAAKIYKFWKNRSKNNNTSDSFFNEGTSLSRQ